MYFPSLKSFPFPTRTSKKLFLMFVIFHFLGLMEVSGDFTPLTGIAGATFDQDFVLHIPIKLHGTLLLSD